MFSNCRLIFYLIAMANGPETQPELDNNEETNVSARKLKPWGKSKQWDKSKQCGKLKP